MFWEQWSQHQNVQFYVKVTATQAVYIWPFSTDASVYCPNHISYICKTYITYSLPKLLQGTAYLNHSISLWPFLVGEIFNALYLLVATIYFVCLINAECISYRRIYIHICIWIIQYLMRVYERNIELDINCALSSQT